MCDSVNKTRTTGARNGEVYGKEFRKNMNHSEWIIAEGIGPLFFCKQIYQST